MDLFGADSDEEEEPSQLAALSLQVLKNFLTDEKPVRRDVVYAPRAAGAADAADAADGEARQADLVLEVAILGGGDELEETLRDRLAAANYVLCADGEAADVVLDVRATADPKVAVGDRACYDRLVECGRLVVLHRAPEIAAFVAFARDDGCLLWRPSERPPRDVGDGYQLLRVPRRGVRLNPDAAGWKYDREKSALLAALRDPLAAPLPESLREEVAHLDELTVPRSKAERRLGGLSLRGVERARASLGELGVVAIPGLFHGDSVSWWGGRVLEDLSDAIELLRRRGVDLLRPGTTPDPVNYRELAMREDLRCDLRRSPRLSAANEALAAAEAGGGPWPCGRSAADGALTRRHPAVMAVLSEAINPRCAENEAGNYGRWNFDFGGPTVRPGLRVGDVGAVISMPGCADQALHADAPHLYDVAQLPPHYVNMFVPVADSEARASFAVGQTAFLPRSHRFATAKEAMEADDRRRRRRLVTRPHLHVGDALLFDTRVIHFGLANAAAPGAAGQEAHRPVLYVNYTQIWYEDPKNWRDEALFPAAGDRRRPERAAGAAPAGLGAALAVGLAFRFGAGAGCGGRELLRALRPA